MSLKSTVLFIATVFALNCFGQQSRVDSLESLVRSVPADTTRVWLLNELVSSMRETDNHKALKYAEEARQLADLLQYKNGLAQALEHLGWIHYRRGDFSKSFALSELALKNFEALKNRAGIARCYINIAAIHHEQKYYQQSIDGMRKALAIGAAINDTYTMARCLNNIAYNYTFLKMLDSAAFYSAKGMNMSEKSGNINMVGFSKRMAGDIAYEKGELDKALNLFNQCYLLAGKTNNTFLKVSSLYRLARNYNAMGYPDKAIEFLDICIAISSVSSYKDELERDYLLLSSIYEKKSDFKRAFQYQSAYLVIHDSLSSERGNEQMALLSTRFDSELQKAQIDLLTQEGLLKEKEIAHQRAWTFFFVGSLGVVLVTAGVLFYYYRVNRTAKHALEKLNREINLQTEQLSNLNQTKDKLFSIISHDLRSPVASLKGLMELVGSDGMSQEEFTSVARSLKKNLDFVFDDLNNLLQWAQSQLKGIQTFPEVVNLQASVHEVISVFSETASRKNIDILNEVEQHAFAFADRNQLKIIVRNLVANAIKFNVPGGTIRISAFQTSDRIEISVADSGTGMAPEDVPKLFNAETHFTKRGTHNEKGIGIGLLLTREFVEKNGGTIRVSSEPGRGSIFTFTLKNGLVPDRREEALSSSSL